MDDQPISSIIKELLQSSYDLIQSEMRLAKAEARKNIRDAVTQIQSMAVYGILAWLGAQILLAFAVIGLGDLIDNYWLSALLIGAALFIPGVILLLYGFKRIKMDARLSTSKASLKSDYNVTTQKIHDITEATRRRSP